MHASRTSSVLDCFLGAVHPVITCHSSVSTHVIEACAHPTDLNTLLHHLHCPCMQARALFRSTWQQNYFYLPQMPVQVVMVCQARYVQHSMCCIESRIPITAAGGVTSSSNMIVHRLHLQLQWQLGGGPQTGQRSGEACSSSSSLASAALPSTDAQHR